MYYCQYNRIKVLHNKTKFKVYVTHLGEHFEDLCLTLPS